MVKRREEYRVVIDQSTSGTKLLLVKIEDQKPLIMKRWDKSHKQIYPNAGWVEHDPIEIINNIGSLFDQLMEETTLTAGDITSISIANQRETIVIWDKKTNKPISNALVWQCNRSIDICEQLISGGKEALIQEKTGLKVDTYFSGSKVKWLFQNENSLVSKKNHSNLAIGTIDTWLIWNLTNQKVFATEPSNASRTLLYNIYSKKWDEELCELFDTPIEALPQIKSSNDSFGKYRGIPIIGVMADSQAALYGQGAIKTGDTKATLGTGCSVMMQIEGNNDKGDDTILKTIGWEIENETSYALEGVIRSCTDTLNWMSEELKLFETVEEGSNIAFSIPSSEGVYLIPAQLGLGAPFWKPEAKAAFVGLNRSSTKAHMIRAGFDAIVYQIKAVLDVMEKTSGIIIQELKVDGGASKNNKLLELLANILQKKILVNDAEEMSALGVLNLLNKDKMIEHNIKKVYKPTSNQEYEYNEWLTYVHQLT